jgi:hypothetical protein
MENAVDDPTGWQARVAYIMALVSGISTSSPPRMHLSSDSGAIADSHRRAGFSVEADHHGGVD